MFDKIIWQIEGGFSNSILFCWSVAWWILNAFCLFENDLHFFQCEEHSKELVGWLLYGIVLHFAVQSVALFWIPMEQRVFPNLMQSSHSEDVTPVSVLDLEWKNPRNP